MMQTMNDLIEVRTANNESFAYDPINHRQVITELLNNIEQLQHAITTFDVIWGLVVFCGPATGHLFRHKM